MERKTHFESQADVQNYFALQLDLWEEATPQPMPDLWEKMAQAQSLNRQSERQPHLVARPDFGALEFPAVKRRIDLRHVKTVTRISRVPVIKVAEKARHRLPDASSLRHALPTRRTKDVIRLDKS